MRTDDVRAGRLRATLRRQDGVIGLRQARDLGLSERSIRRRVAARIWVPVGPTVFQAADHEITPGSTVRAALLSLGDHATLVGVSAAWWWHLHDTAPAPVQVAVDPVHQPRPRIGVAIRRVPVDPVDRTVSRGVALTKPTPTVLEAATRLGLVEGARLMDRALLREKVRLEGLREVHERTAGRSGTVVARRLLALAEGGARSEAERVAHRALRRGGVVGWTANRAIDLPGHGRAVGDVVFEAERVVLEIDGWTYHRELRAFLVDGPRQSALAAAGWLVLRTHWYELTETPEQFLRTLRASLARRANR